VANWRFSSRPQRNMIGKRSWQCLGTRSEIHKSTAHRGQCDGKLRSVVIRAGEVVENARRLGTESA
jgi:hypothetical protein